MYVPLLRRLAALNYSSIACNQRGYSLDAPQNEQDYLYQNLRQDAFAVAAVYFGSSTRFHLIGHDHGAMLGWTMAASDNAHTRIASWTALSVPHADAFSNGLYGPNSDVDQQISSQYFTMFVDNRWVGGSIYCVLRVDLDASFFFFFVTRSLILFFFFFFFLSCLFLSLPLLISQISNDAW